MTTLRLLKSDKKLEVVDLCIIIFYYIKYHFERSYCLFTFFSMKKKFRNVENSMIFEKMLDEESVSYEKLQVEQYVTELQDYWNDYQAIFKLDSVSFLYLWGSMLTWTMITVLCLMIGVLSYSQLPTEIPVQWSNGVATSLVNKNWIFICPVICIVIRYLLKPFIYVKLQMNNYYGEMITEYLTNYMCFLVLSIEIFSILFTFGVVKSIVLLLFVNTIVFIGLLVVGLTKMDLRRKKVL